MNIKQAKEQIKNAMVAYFTKDEFGNYVLPIEKQRPVFLMGPPGIGKTAIMEQIASELGVGLVSYSMTHHTRQSALGLPFIVTKNYDGKECEVSEYTMSEIIATVYETIESTGYREGILFLDEINCVSETLAPVMLQFLQYKIFGRHSVPKGWIVVTAGNPPEYNNSVREFDIVTWDRLKRIDVEADYDVWKEYAYHSGVHAAVTTYLDIKKSDFYSIETTVDGKTFVTARGWVDLSDMIKLYEKNNIAVDQQLIGQYLQNKKIAKSFAIYYDLFNKYKSDYQIDSILSGNASTEIKDRAKKAKFDERLTVIGLILDKITENTRDLHFKESVIVELLNELKSLRTNSKFLENPIDFLRKQISVKEKALSNGIKASSLSQESQYVYRKTIEKLEKIIKLLETEKFKNSDDAFEKAKKFYDNIVQEFKKQVKEVGDELSNAFKFCEEVYETDGQEILILVTELTINYYCAKFISRYGCPEYFKHNNELLFFERQNEIIKKIESLELK